MTPAPAESWEKRLEGLDAINYNLYLGEGINDNCLVFEDALKQIKDFIHSERTTSYEAALRDALDALPKEKEVICAPWHTIVIKDHVKICHQCSMQGAENHAIQQAETSLPRLLEKPNGNEQYENTNI